VVCDGIIIFKDVASRTLKLFQEGLPLEQISSGPVLSFAVAGDQIIYLTEENSLRAVSISTRIDEVIAHNVNSFFYNGKFWIQNNTDIYAQPLSENAMAPLTCEKECRRILGMTSDYLIFDSLDAVCVYDLKEQYCTLLSNELVFVGASDDGALLVYNMDIGIYQIIQL
jgi:hypothetical protein